MKTRDNLLQSLYYLPITVPQGYFRPRNFFPSTSNTVFEPTTAKGTRSLIILLILFSSSSSQSGNS